MIRLGIKKMNLLQTLCVLLILIGVLGLAMGFFLQPTFDGLAKSIIKSQEEVIKIQEDTIETMRKREPGF